MLLVLARLQRLDRSLEEAALDLGASHGQVLRRITLPFLRPALFTAAILAFFQSFENFNTTLFTRGSASTLTIYIASRVRTGLTPSVNALALILIGLTIVAAIVYVVLRRRDRRPNRHHPGQGSMNEIVEKSACELRAMIATKTLSPVEVFDAFSARIAAVDPAINAMVALDLERGRAAAKDAERAVMRGDKLGVLCGLPVGIKDLNLTAGLRTTFGSLVYKDNVPEQDELLVARIRAAGGIVIGKTNTPEFGSGANTINRVYGATVNPFDTGLSVAGSSGGSAAALATDMVPLATGSDLGGSLRTPASFCGVVGHRPSPGACPSDQAGNAWSPLAVEGPMGRTVADTALLMAAMVGDAPIDPISQALSAGPFATLPAVNLRKLRIAVSPDLGTIPIAPEVRVCFHAAIERMSPLFGEVRWRDPGPRRYRPDVRGAARGRIRPFVWRLHPQPPQPFRPQCHRQRGILADPVGRGCRPRPRRADRAVPEVPVVLRRHRRPDLPSGAGRAVSGRARLRARGRR